MFSTLDTVYGSHLPKSLFASVPREIQNFFTHVSQYNIYTLLYILAGNVDVLL